VPLLCRGRHNSGTLPPIHELFKRPSYIYLKLVVSIWYKEELPQQQKESVTVPFIKGVTKLTAVILEGSLFCQHHTKL